MTRAEGVPRRFSVRARCEHPESVWRLWTTPSTWGRWDGDARLAMAARHA